jgi:O-succinylbenzoic acid--CoA ligase
VARLVALDLAAGPAFVDALRRVWDAGDAALPVDQRLPRTAKAALLAAMRPGAAIGPDGDETVLDGGEPVEPGDALVVATSGSTGTPRGVVFTHLAVEAAARACHRRLAVTGDDHWLACLPLSHIGGLGVVCRSLVTGTRLTVLPGIEGDEVAAAGATLVALVPTALTRVDVSAFRVVLLGGSRPPSALPDNAVTTYGLTESGGGVVYDGHPLDGIEVRVADDGEILVAGPSLLRCYRDGVDPRQDGWLHTGDVGGWGADGRLVVAGRRADLIITGGENVWPEPVEDALRRHPAVADVAVTGLPDDDWGEVVTAFVVPTAGATPPTLDELRAVVKEVLPAFCAPRRLELRQTLPVTTSGKPRRHELRARP